MYKTIYVIKFRLESDDGRLNEYDLVGLAFSNEQDAINFVHDSFGAENWINNYLKSEYPEGDVECIEYFYDEIKLYDTLDNDELDLTEHNS